MITTGAISQQPLVLEEARLFRPDGTKRCTFYECLTDVAAGRYEEVKKWNLMRPDETEIYVRVPCRVNFAGGPWTLLHGKEEIVVFGFTCEILFEILQSRYEFDRQAPFDYALVVENMINSRRYIASKRTGAEAMLTEMKPSPEVDEEVPLQNGSIAKVLCKGLRRYEMLDAKASIHPRTVQVKLLDE